MGVRNGQQREQATGEGCRREAPLKESALELSRERGDVNEAQATPGAGLGQGIIRDDLRDAAAAIADSRTEHRMEGAKLRGGKISEAKDIT